MTPCFCCSVWASGLYRTKQPTGTDDADTSQYLWHVQRANPPTGSLARLLATTPATQQPGVLAPPAHSSLATKLHEIGQEVQQAVQQLLEHGVVKKKRRTDSAERDPNEEQHSCICAVSGLYVKDAEGNTEWFMGKLIRSDDEDYYRAVYDDGDAEEFTEADVAWVLRGGEFISLCTSIGNLQLV